MLEFPSIAINVIFSYMIVFSRIGSALMVLPGISEIYVSARVRLIFALAISGLIMSNIEIPKIPQNIVSLSLMLFNEALIGLFLGSITKFLVSVMHILGIIIATVSGLGSAMLFDPTQGSQGAIIGNFLSNLSIVLLFASNMHHMLIFGFAESYSAFKVNSLVNILDMNQEIIKIIGKVYEIALKLAAPQIVVAMIIMVGGGILGRLMPAIQIFNLFPPLQMLISFLIIMVTLSASITWYIENIYDINKAYLFH